MGTLRRGLIAGAFGTVLLNAATYLDMALTGRPASMAPARAVARTAGAFGIDLRGDDDRAEAYGALGGIATGLGLGVLASLTRSAGVRLPAPLGAAAIGSMAMAATDAPMAAAGVSDPTEWSGADWLRDAVPHLAYGAGVRWAMDWSDRQDSRDTASTEAREATDEHPPARPSLVGTVARSLALGVATGGRSSLALGGPVLTARGGRPGYVAAGLVTTELVIDKVPGVSSRLRPGPLAARMGSGAVGAAALARHRDAADAHVALAALTGGAAAFAGSIAGAAWRDIAADRDWPGWRAGAVEDAVALGLTVIACR
ncbi:hypothetical protein [Nocardioides sp. YIM 152315]|uniref:hypothetical protein n=1 Tax=Nocardioides sp. YIM 152315 TaxID=3031760 RepID=UPI0023DB9A89|nr:hypothetical protein [Nocardioides sp. YIM 152315]MDF1606082.1 hypothetical protein [Nocardioides sp. YIM 152315]